MNQELNAKLNTILKSIQSSLDDIKRNGRKARELKAAVKKSRDIVTEVLEQQLGGVSLEQQINISGIPDDDWLITARHIIDEINDPFVPENEYENYFLQLINYLIGTDIETLSSNMQYSFNKISNINMEAYDRIMEEFEKRSLLTERDEKTDIPTVFESRAAVLKQHSYDFLWLYRRLQDYTSKRTLAAVLMDWADFQFAALGVVKSIFKKYWEPDIFPNNRDDLLVCVGAADGTSIKDYTDVYGKGYKKICAYEVSPRIFSELQNNMSQWELHDTEAFNKGAGNVKTKRAVSEKKEKAGEPMIRLFKPETDEKKPEKTEQFVDIVRLDDDLKDIPTFITIDVGEDTQNVLSGCAKTIKKNKPKLAVNLDGEPDDLWRIPFMISTLESGYKFWLRYYGSEVASSDYVILCRAE